MIHRVVIGVSSVVTNVYFFVKKPRSSFQHSVGCKNLCVPTEIYSGGFGRNLVSLNFYVSTIYDSAVIPGDSIANL